VLNEINCILAAKVWTQPPQPTTHFTMNITSVFNSLSETCSFLHPKQMETINPWFSRKNVHHCQTKHLAAIIAWYFGTLWHCSGWSKS